MKLITEYSYPNMDKLQSTYYSYPYVNKEEANMLIQSFLVKALHYSDMDGFRMSISLK